MATSYDLEIIVRTKKQGDAIEQTNKQMDGLGKTIGRIITTGAVLALGKQLLDAGNASINAASDVQEAASKFSNVFGPAAKATGAALDEFAAAAGRSHHEMRSMAGDLGALIEPMVGNKDAAGEMSTQLAILATDLSSFFNVAESDALTALRAGLVGETEPMRQFGVNISAAAVEARILASGIVDTKAEITDAMRVQERYNMMLEGTALAHGDAIETADGYANTSRRLEAATQDLAVAFGQGLLPAATDVKAVLADMATQAVGPVAAWAQLKTAVHEGTLSYVEANKMFMSIATSGKTAGEVLAELEEKTDHLTIGTEQYMSSAGMTAEQVAALTAETEGLVEAEDEAIGTSEALADKLAQQAAQTGSTEQMVRAANLALQQQVETQEAAAAAAAEFAAKQAELAAASGDYFAEAMETDRANRLIAQSLGTVSTYMVEVGGRTEEQSEELDRLQGIYDKAQQTIADYQMGLRGVNMEEEAFNDKLAEQATIAANAQAAMAPLLGVTSQYTTATSTASVNTDVLNNFMIEQADAAGASAEQTAALALSRGILTEEEARAMVQEAMLKTETERLMQLYAEEKLTLDQVNASMDRFIAGLQGVPPETASASAGITDAKESLLAGADAAGQFTGALAQIPSEIPVHIAITADPIPALPSYPGGASPIAFQHGGYAHAGSMYQVGEGNLPEFLKTKSGLYMIPGDDGRVFSNSQSKGMMGGGYTDNSQITIVNQTREATALAMANVQLLKKAKMNSYMGAR